MINAEKKLFTPGPLCTSPGVRAALTRDLGSRDTEFIELVKDIRQKLLDVAGVSSEEYTAVLMQGSGTFSVEAVFQTAAARNGKTLILENGSYGRRMAQICSIAGIEHDVLSTEQNKPHDPERLSSHLQNNNYSLVAAVHCETSSGVFNDVTELGRRVKEANRDAIFFVDAMSSFGAAPFDFETANIDFLVSSANKCLQGVPGFAFILARKSVLENCKGNSRSLSLDIEAQYRGLEANGQFRFTPPTHALLGFRHAIREFEEEGGLPARTNRYMQNCDIIRDGMRRWGFREFIDKEAAGHIITSFYYPKHNNFSFKEFYKRLNDKDQVIYPGVLVANCFRIGNIGHLFPEDMRHLLACIEEVCADMKIPLPLEE